MTNSLGTANLLESIRLKNLDPTVVLAGSSEEYGLVFSSQLQHNKALDKYGCIVPAPTGIPELPISEENPLRPQSPYAISKVQADYLMRSYHNIYGLRTIIFRAFNTEGAGRGSMFVTATIRKTDHEVKAR